jgi:hypothetical protein
LHGVAPGCSRSQNPKDTVQDTTIIHPRNTTRLIGQHRFDGCPFTPGIRQIYHEIKLGRLLNWKIGRLRT